MLRLAGCLMLIISCSFCGYELSSRLRRHTVYIKKAVSMLKVSGELIRFRRLKKDELISELRSDIRFSELFSPDCKSLLRPEESKLIDAFLSSVGTTDCEGQQAMTELYVSELERAYSASKEEEKNKCRVYEVLGFAAGAFLSVMFI